MTGCRSLFRMLAVALMPLLASCSGQSYKIVGHAEGYDGTAVLSYTDLRGSRDTDTTSVIGGDFSFRGKIDDSYSAQLLIKQPGKHMITAFLVLEPGTIQVSMEEEPDAVPYVEGAYPCKAVVKGTRNNEFLTDLDASTKTDGTMASADFRNAMLECIRRHKDCEYAAFLYGCYFSYLPLDRFVEEFSTFTPKVQKSKLAANVRGIIESRQVTAPGREAPDFTLKDLEGNPVKLSSFRGKYVVLDFWASWCKPCRSGVPAMKELYAKYHEKGLEVIAVSQDSDADQWKKAVEEDGAEYIHLIDETDEVDKSPRVGSAYRVSSIPAYFLLDREGRFVGKFDHSGLEEQLAGLLQ